MVSARRSGPPTGDPLVHCAAMPSLLASWSSWSLLSATLALTACTDGATAPAPTGSTSRAVAMAPAGQRPRLFAGAGDRVAAATPTDAAIAYVARLAPTWGAPDGTAALAPIATVKNHLGDLVRLQQSIDGVAVHRRELRVLVRPDGSLGLASGVLVRADVPRHGRFALTPADAVARAVAVTQGVGPMVASLVPRAGAVAADEAWFHSPAGAMPFVEEARVQQRWHDAGDHLEAAWVVEAYSAPTDGDTDSLAFRTVVSADTGKILAQTNLTADAFNYRVWAETGGDRRPLDGPTVDFTPNPTGLPNGPRPAFIPPNLVSVDGLNHPAGGGAGDPWLAAGATETKGNHVDAYTDRNAPDGFAGADFRASTTAAGAFDRVYDPTRSPLVNNAQMMASITQLFYTMNWLHDDWYDAGFTEAAGNGQDDNFGRGGVGGDHLKAEAQDAADAGARNNANMSTPGDGMSPRMQVYLWSGADHISVTATPGGALTASAASFDPPNYNVTGLVIAGMDGTAPNLDGCQAITNNVTGKFVVVDRGNCTFKRKAVNLQAAGASGVIIVNNAAGLPGLSNDNTINTAITIPVIGLTTADGTALRTALMNGPVSYSIVRRRDPDNDGTLDGGLVAHEYGHYLHHRLSECNTYLCGAMSEGWADFSALMMVLRPGDDLDGTYAMSTYAESGDPYFGIRRAPYSVNFDRNAFTLKMMASGAALPSRHPVLRFGDNSEVHNAGEIWAEMMWEAYVALQKSHGDFAATRRTMQEYVVDGLLMAPVDATVTEMRDAILQAAFLANPADHDTLAAAFARRGAGSCAQSPDRTSADFTEVAESYELKPNSTAATPVLTIDVHDCDHDGVLDVGETATVRTTVGNNGAADLGQTTIALTSTAPGLEVKTAPIVVPSVARYTSMPVEFEVALTAGLAPVAGDLTLIITSATACSPSLAIATPLRMNVDDKPNASATDTFDANPSAWTATGDGAPTIWKQVRDTALDGEWYGLDFGAPSETSIESPPMVATSGAVTITFDHAYDFELSDQAYDGSVIEVTTDAGATWQDVGAMASPGYTAAIAPDSGNPLANRMAFTGRNAAFPAKEKVTVSLGTSLAGKTFKFRFLIGTDAAANATGWRIDDVVVTGISNKPFPSQISDAGTCNPDKPPADDGGCCQTGGRPTGDVVGGLLVLGLLLRPRRKR